MVCPGPQPSPPAAAGRRAPGYDAVVTRGTVSPARESSRSSRIAVARTLAGADMTKIAAISAP